MNGSIDEPGVLHGERDRGGQLGRESDLGLAERDRLALVVQEDDTRGLLAQRIGTVITERTPQRANEANGLLQATVS